MNTNTKARVRVMHISDFYTATIFYLSSIHLRCHHQESSPTLLRWHLSSALVAKKKKKQTRSCRFQATSQRPDGCAVFLVLPQPQRKNHRTYRGRIMRCCRTVSPNRPKTLNTSQKTPKTFQILRTSKSHNFFFQVGAIRH